MYYVEFYDRPGGVSVKKFHESATTSFPEWVRRYPEDELVGNVGRTWRLGPYPYLLIWGCRDFGRLREWDEIFHSEVVDDLEAPLLEIVSTSAAGFYRDLVVDLPRPVEGPFYLETFATGQAPDDLVERARNEDITLNLAVERVGLLGPYPGGIALYTLRSLAQIGSVAESAPSWVIDVGCYETVGREIL